MLVTLEFKPGDLCLCKSRRRSASYESHISLSLITLDGVSGALLRAVVRD